MPMGTDPIQPDTVDPRDAEIANLRAQLAKYQSSTPVASLQAPEVAPEVAPMASAVQAVEAAAKPEISKLETEVKDAAENAFTHYLHLADGRVMKLVGTVTHWFDSDAADATGVPVIGVYPAK